LGYTVESKEGDERMSTNNKQLYRGSYPRRSKAVREAAKANPNTRCWRCGKTYAEALRMWGPVKAAWQAGHVVDSHPGSPLAPEHAKCNEAAGGRLGNARRQTVEPRSPNA
jgi:hypothetical protein